MTDRSATQRVLRNARLANDIGDREPSLVDVHIQDGRIERISPAGETAPRTGPPAETEDLGGRLLLPSMAEPHAHLDKALLGDGVPNLTGDLMGAIDVMIAAEGRGHFRYDETVTRAITALERMLINGVTAVRSHADVWEGVGADNVRAIDEARRSLSGLIDVQIVSLMGGPLTGSEGAGQRAALRKALEQGIDVVGGCPALDPDPVGHIRVVLKAATEAGLPLDLHIDETLDPTMLTLRELTRQVQETGFAHAVTASHCVSLAVQSRRDQEVIALEVAAAGIAVVALPHTNLYLQGRDHPVGMPRAITPVNVLREAGVMVAAGADNVQDPFNPMGRCDPLETAALLALASHQLPPDAYRMVSNDARSVLGLQRVHMMPGDPADFVAIDSSSVRAAIADAPGRRTYRGGRLVAESAWTSRLHR